MIAGLVLAAGAGRRFGGGKQLAELDGRPLLEHALLAIGAAGLGRVVVVLGSDAEAVRAGVDLHGAEAVVCERWAEGQAASLACALAHLEEVSPPGQPPPEHPGQPTEPEAVIVALGDQPSLRPETFRRLLGARGSAPAVRATYGGEPGHPVLLERELLGELRDVTGDTGARGVLRRAGVRDIPCDDLGGGADVDTQEQLAALRGGASLAPRTAPIAGLSTGPAESPR